MSPPSPISRRKILQASLTLPMLTSTRPASAVVDSKRTPASDLLVAYFSRSGNTRVIAGQIGRALSATLFEIQPATPYPDDYYETVELARRQRDSDHRPRLKVDVQEMVQFRTVFLGFPIWGETVPPLIRSFLFGHDLSGKTLVPFITHGGYGIGNSLQVLAAHAPGAQVLDAGLIMQADQEKQTLERVTRWLKNTRLSVGPVK